MDTHGLLGLHDHQFGLVPCYQPRLFDLLNDVVDLGMCPGQVVHPPDTALSHRSQGGREEHGSLSRTGRRLDDDALFGLDSLCDLSEHTFLHEVEVVSMFDGLGVEGQGGVQWLHR